MAEKDITEKILMSYADVFADCVNALVYGGEQRLSAENTQPAPTESFYNGRRAFQGKKPHQQFCDISRYLIRDGSIIIQYIIENETQLQERQIFRELSYQGGAYRQQLESSKPAYGVIAIVMAWTGKTNRIPLGLHDLLTQNGVPAEELELMDDAQLTVYRMNNLSPEIRKRFISGMLFFRDMGFVADYLNEGTFEGRKEQKIVHLEALCDMMEALTGDAQFTEQAEMLLQKLRKGEPIMMCEYLTILESKGEAKLTSLLEKLYDLGRDEEAKLAVRDMDARARLYQEFRIPNYSSDYEGT